MCVGVWSAEAGLSFAVVRGLTRGVRSIAEVLGCAVCSGLWFIGADVDGERYST